MVYQTNNPVLLITTYTRLDKLSRCVRSLQDCESYGVFDIHIFSDGPRSNEDIIDVNATRVFLKSLSDDNIFLHFSDKNNGSRFQTRHGMKTLKSLGYSSYLFLEEDIVVSNEYLIFMREHLDRFCNVRRILAISAFTHAALLAGMNRKAYTSHRFSPWGFGSWFDRDLWHEHIRDSVIESKLNSISFKGGLIASGYDVLPNIIFPLIKGQIIQADYRATMMSLWFNNYSIYPCSTKVYNIGLDGSGINCSNLNLSDDYTFLDEYESIPEIPKTLIRTQEFLYTRSFRRLYVSIILLILPYKWVKSLYRCLLK